ncbi:MAG: DNA polymerase III subunit gamma/tau [Oscillospiraceae bacterium]|nr:DNA polymerase III subunit gamma/tau [Oscillospiraceae bacterium]
MYQALYRKYRPQTFDDVVGQGSVTETLKSQLDSGRLSHAYLFTGSRGTGKTSCAKILAKAVNCEQPQGGNPCNRCAACRSIDAGSCVDVLEIDAASNNGVDHVRALRDEAVYTPSQVKKRVYIIDEVHMLSIAAFNALLKIIEEPPEHLLFILATTELHKVPATILSRCQRFSFRRIRQEDIADRLQFVAYQEKIDLQPDAAALLARLGDGALRDGLSLLDQCASASDGTVTRETVCGVLGLAGEQRTAELLLAIAAHDAPAALTVFGDLYAAGKDLAAMLGELGSLARDLLIAKTAPKLADLSAVATEQRKQLADALSPAELLRVVSTVQQTASGFASSADRRLDTELCLLELCDPSLSQDASALSARIGRLETQHAAGVTVQAKPAPAPEKPKPQAAETPKEAPKPAASPAAQGDTLPQGFWPEYVEKIKGVVPPGIFGQLKGAVRPVLQDDKLFLESDADVMKRLLKENPAILPRLNETASAMLGRQVEVRAVVEGERAGVSQDDPMQMLLDFGGEHGDIFHINQ